MSKKNKSVKEKKAVKTSNGKEPVFTSVAIDEAMKILNKIETTTKELHAIFWEIKKGPKKLKEKFNK